MNRSLPRRQPRSRAPRPAAWHRLLVEPLEDRVLPSINVPSPIDPTQAPQTLFAPDPTRLEILAQSPGPESRLFRFALDGQTPGQPVTFTVAPAAPNDPLDAAVGLYDADGNLLASANPGLPGTVSLTAGLDTRRVYVLGVFYDSPGPLADLDLTVTPGPQVVNSAIILDPGTGTATRAADAGEDLFNAPADVDYYPLTLTNAGATGTVTVTPTGLGVRPFATLFRRAGPQDPWQPLASGDDSAAFTLPLTAPTGKDLTDAQYLLALAPDQFDTPASSYQIDVAAPTLASASFIPAFVAQATNLLTPYPVAPGVARATASSSFTGAPALYRFRAPADGVATVTLASQAFAPLLAAYDVTGQTLLQAASSTQPGTATLSLPVTAGTEYVLDVARVGSLAGAYDLTITAPYQPTPVVLVAGAGSQLDAVAVGPGSGAQFYQVNVAPGTDVLAVQVTPPPGSTDNLAIAAVGLPGGPVAPMPAGPGQTAFLALPVTGQAGPIDLYVAGSGGDDPVRIHLGQFQVPAVLKPDQLAAAAVGLDGNLQETVTDPGAFGQVAGLKYYQLPAAPAQPAPATAFTAQGTGGALPLLARYELAGGVFHLAGFQVPDASASAQLSAVVGENQVEGVAAFALDVAGAANPAPQIQLQVHGPKPAAVGVGMVPNHPPALPGQLPPAAPFESDLNIRNATLPAAYAQQLYQTILPDNLVFDPNRLPAVTLKLSSAASALRAHVEVYNAADLGQPLAQGTNDPGKDLSPLPLAQDQAGVAALRGATLLLRVSVLDAAPDNLGDGIYTLGLTAATTDPGPFEVVQTAWRFAGTNPMIEKPSQPNGPKQPDAGSGDADDVGTFPAGLQVTDIVQNQFGHGTATGAFTSSAPVDAQGHIDPGTIAVYRFWAINPGPVSVKTVSLDDQHVNTNLRVYRARTDTNHVPFLGQLTNTVVETTGDPPTTSADTALTSFDWYQADRSQIDAQSYINDFDLLRYDETGDTDPYGAGLGGAYYVLVRNQEGSQGKFEIEVDAAPFTLAGDNGQAAYLPAAGGSTDVHVNLDPSYFPVQVPPDHAATLTIASKITTGVSNLWDLAVFDAQGQPLPGAAVPLFQGPGTAYTVGTFTVPDGPQTVYLRARALSDDPAASTDLTLSMSATFPDGPPPPSTLPGTATGTLFPTDPFGNTPAGGNHDAVAATGDVRTYAFREGAGPLTVAVTPDVPGAVNLRWGVYVHQQLVGWGQTGQGPGGSTFLLPDLRQPVPDPDAGFDPGPYEDVVLRVEALGLRGNGGFTVALASGAGVAVPQEGLSSRPVGLPDTGIPGVRPLPLRDADLALDPRQTTATAADPGATGLDWLRLVVPEDSSGPVTLVAQPGLGRIGELVRYDLYDPAGQLVSSDTAPVGLLSRTAVLPLVGAVGGTSYYLRVGLVDDAAAAVPVTVSVALPKAALVAADGPAAFIHDFLASPLEPANPGPDGHFETDSLHTTPTVFWVARPGKAEFVGFTDNAADAYVALYRAEGVPMKENPTDYRLTLVDYQNRTDVPAGHAFDLTAYLDPGPYVLMVGHTLTEAFSGNLPAYPQEELVLDPNFGENDFPNLRAIDTARSQLEPVPPPLLESFRTVFYHVTAPSGSLDGLTVAAHGLSFADLNDREAGPATLTLWTRASANDPYVQHQPGPDDQPVLADPHNLGPLNAPAQVTVADAPPGQDFVIGFSRDGLASEDAITAQFSVPFSGTPDLEVTAGSIQLLPDGGQTLVEITVRNRGFAPSGDTQALYEYSDHTKNPEQLTTSQRAEAALGPLGSRTYAVAWQPQSPADHVEYVTDTAHLVDELDETNNDSGPVFLSGVDPHAPATPALQTDLGDLGNGTWGRFVRNTKADNPFSYGGPESDLHATVQDQDGDLYQLQVELPFSGAPASTGVMTTQALNVGNTKTAVPVLIAKDYRFWDLFPTTAQVPNRVKVTAVDAFGLASAEAVRTIQVVPFPTWLTDFKWDDSTEQYKLGLHEAILDFGDPDNPGDPIPTFKLLGLDKPDDVPLIGSAENLFLVLLDSDLTAPLIPNGDINPTVGTTIQLELANANVLNQTFKPGGPVPDGISIDSTLLVNGQTLQPKNAALSFHVQGFPVDNFESPQVPIFSYGVPDVAELQANLQFTISVTLSAALTVGLDLNAVQKNVAQIPLVVQAPTFLELSAQLSGDISGEADVLKFPIASVSGGVDFTLNLTYGLDTPAGTPVALSDFLAHLNPFSSDPARKTAVDLSADLGVHVKGKVIGLFTVFDFEPPKIHFDFVSNGTILQALAVVSNPPPLVVVTGNDKVGPAQADPSPNLVIDTGTGQGLYVEVRNARGPDGTLGNLAFATGSGAASWTTPSLLAQPENVSDPVLALTHDQPGAPAVVVYSALPLPAGAASVSDLTLNQALTGQDLRYRYYDGSSWQPEQRLTDDDRYDSDPVVSFNGSGQGVVAWVHNTAATPMLDGQDANGNPTTALDAGANEIAAAVWDQASHAWQPMEMLTTDQVPDSRPAVFAAADGTLYVAWLRDVNGAPQPWYRVYSQGAWSAPAALPVTGLPAGGQINSLALGSDGADHVDVLLWDARKQADGSTASVLYNRPSTEGSFAQPATLQTVAQGTDFSHLRTLPDPRGGLLAYWQANNGAVDDVFAARLASVPAPTGWSAPVRLTTAPGLKLAPSLAVGADGALDVAYETVQRPDTGLPPLPKSSTFTDQPLGIQAADGVGTSGLAALPELGFTQALSFPGREATAGLPDGNAAPAGTQVTGQAQIVNRGLADTLVQVDYTVAVGEDTSIVDTQRIFLAAGDTYDVRHDFPVQPGTATYSVRVTAVNADHRPVGEAVTTADDVSSATLQGRADVAVTGVTLSDPTPHDGETVTVTVALANLGDLPVPAFAVALTQGDPAFATTSLPAVLLGTQPVSGMAALQTATVTFPWTVPVGGGVFDLTARADPGGTLTEAARGNNVGHADVRVLPDAAVVPGGGVSPVTATVLDYSGVNNVQVTAIVTNLGRAGLVEVPVELLWSLDDGSLQVVGQKTLPALAAGAQATVAFDKVSGLAGHNRYRVVVDPAAALVDDNPANNVAETVLVLEGLPDLVVRSVAVDQAAPVQGDPVTVRATIGNTGIAPARGVLVEVFAGDPGGGQLVGQTTLANLAALSDTTVAIPINTARLAGEQRLAVVVDRTEQVLEVSDLNNRGGTTVFFKPSTLPPLPVVLPVLAPEAVHDVTAVVGVLRVKLRRRGSSRMMLMLHNGSGRDLDGPVSLVVTGLPRKVKLRGRTGVTRAGRPYVDVVPSGGVFRAGASLTVALAFSGPGSQRPKFTTQVLAGVGPR
jgi:hypothetical protein